MREHAPWLWRRLRRLVTLLRHQETRGAVLRFLIAETAGRALIHGRGVLRRLRGRRLPPEGTREI